MQCYYGLVVNYKALEALAGALERKSNMGQKELLQTMEEHGVTRFPSPYVAGFRWNPEGIIELPSLEKLEPADRERLMDLKKADLDGDILTLAGKELPPARHPGNPFRVQLTDGNGSTSTSS